MASRTLLALILALVALPAWGDTPPKPVEVVNFSDPQNVTVSNTPLPVTPVASGRFQLVGFTTDPASGGQGVLGFTARCQEDFAESRMCTSVEVMETVTAPANLSGDAWVRPVFQPHQLGNVVLDASGAFAASNATNLTCLQWSSSGGTEGLAVDATGVFSRQFCNVPRSVACCALQ